jgi:hypothetical protein
MLQIFKGEYHQMAVLMDCCWTGLLTDLESRCIYSPPTVDDNGNTVTTKEIDESFFVHGSKCLRLAAVEGRLDCKFYMDDGLDSDSRAVLFMKNKKMKTHASGLELDWQVDGGMVPDPDKMTATVSYSKASCDCIFSRQIHY